MQKTPLVHRNCNSYGHNIVAAKEKITLKQHFDETSKYKSLIGTHTNTNTVCAVTQMEILYVPPTITYQSYSSTLGCHKK